MHGSIQRAQQQHYQLWRTVVNDGAYPGSRELLNASIDYWLQTFLCHTSSFHCIDAAIRYFNRIMTSAKRAESIGYMNERDTTKMTFDDITIHIHHNK
jgi:hypothetical protein